MSEEQQEDKNVEIINAYEKKEKNEFSFKYFMQTIPILPFNLALMILLCNICFPSLGTFYMACIGNKPKKIQIIVGIIQLFLTPLIIGYIWSIFWGIKAINISYSSPCEDKNQKNQ
jgi:hypothetical protein